MKQFHAGWRDELDGIEFRCVQGRKHPDDLVIEWYTEQGWRRITANVLGLLVEFLYENEEVLYPRPQYQGGRKVFEHLERAITNGYQNAASELSKERATSNARPVPLGARSA